MTLTVTCYSDTWLSTKLCYRILLLVEMITMNCRSFAVFMVQCLFNIYALRNFNEAILYKYSLRQELLDMMCLKNAHTPAGKI